MSYVFISGIPTAGKSYLATQIGDEFDVHVEKLDDFREEMKNDPELEPWVNYYWNKDPRKYAQKDCQLQWDDLVAQSEAFWPATKAYMEQKMQEHDAIVFESVNLLPHLAIDLSFSGVYLLGESLEQTIDRNKREPRWSKEEDIQEREARHFYLCEGPRYKHEAEKYGFLTFVSPDEAKVELIRLLNK